MDLDRSAERLASDTFSATHANPSLIDPTLSFDVLSMPTVSSDRVRISVAHRSR